MTIHPYLFFDGCCEEALAFYESAVGAEITAMMRYSDMPPDAGPSRLPPGSETKIMHASLRIGDREIMASDGMCGGAPSFQGFSLSITVPDVATADSTFAALAEGGEVRMPPMATFYSPRFGMLADKFGVAWMVMAAPVEVPSSA